ncbi:MAG: hypothetical protein A3D67_01905 [Candidatus Lloydbacteria bacterium RIFCSPHIGHO2_02_FULL_51_22]|uniref:Type II secretion system protein GspF domain-containing protein n=2 Tax=Candidatus Lloydiibacteriota TaxID=1817910 RepID=A0A1G2DCG8_9BACT|nr:MAG: hypothetical protein A3D67_01905 [Candidatus Lloydbacteria bacterium RIFCSPHIGHO2_02_FULL_51_22]OGZ15570.1 MAG: hypothetical protein A3J08_01255 [Candidatus Lloydbacteria bacterium RIFCSPLOWO2_02_FULL_51_11]
MLFKYSAISPQGEEKNGTINTVNMDVAVSTLQRQGLTVINITPADNAPFWKRGFVLFDRIALKDIVIFSRQLSTLFVAHVSALKVFRMLAAESDNPLLRQKIAEVADDVQGGLSISDAFAKHPAVFSDFYVNMVRAGEESGKLSETFEYMADYLDRSYALTMKVRNALIYPAFIIAVFTVVMVLLFTMVFPRLASILLESGQPIPVFTQVVIGFSNFLINYGLFLLIALIIGGFFAWRYSRSLSGRLYMGRLQLQAPLFGNLFRKFYLARTADVLYTMLTSGVPVVHAIEVAAAVVGSAVYENILSETAAEVRSGSTISNAFAKHEEVPSILVQIIRIGEETGEVGRILKTLSEFYRRDVNDVIDAVISLIEPAIIVLLGVSVGTVLASVLIPIYNISTSI